MCKHHKCLLMLSDTTLVQLQEHSFKFDHKTCNTYVPITSKKCIFIKNSQNDISQNASIISFLSTYLYLHAYFTCFKSSSPVVKKLRNFHAVLLDKFATLWTCPYISMMNSSKPLSSSWMGCWHAYLYIISRGWLLHAASLTTSIFSCLQGDQ